MLSSRRGFLEGLGALSLGGTLGCDAGQSSLPGEPAAKPNHQPEPEPDAGTTPAPVTPGGYQVLGNQILDADGQVHHFHGVARPSLEWNAQGEGISPDDFQRMADWGANVVRLALNQAFWLRTPGYVDTVKSAVSFAQAAGLDVILDLHWSDKGSQAMDQKQQDMADANSLLFWQEVALAYKDDGRVLFELYNEPRNIDWSMWRNGGAHSEGWAVIGMQQLLDAIRAQGANNIVIAGGLDWAYDLRGVRTHALDGFNVAYATHLYDVSHKLPPSWDNDWGFVADEHPVFISEFGIHDGGVYGASCSQTQYYSDVLSYASAKGAHFTAWAWFPSGCGFPSLISDWAANTTQAGAVVKAALGAFPR